MFLCVNCVSTNISSLTGRTISLCLLSFNISPKYEIISKYHSHKAWELVKKELIEIL